MGVRIQELPETTGINKEDVLIVEDGQGTKKGTVKQLDETLGVSQLKEDLDNKIDTDSLIYETKVLKDKDYSVGYVAVSTGVPTEETIRGVYTNELLAPNTVVNNSDPNTYGILGFRYVNGVFKTYINITDNNKVLADGYMYRIYVYYKEKGLYTNITQAEAEALKGIVKIISTDQNDFRANNPHIESLENRIEALENITDIDILPSYYHENHYLKNKVKFIKDNMCEVGLKGETFVFITDPHWDLGNAKQSPKLIKYIKEHTSLDNVICGGDIINEGLHDDMRDVFIDFVNEMKKIGIPFPIAYGNHDNNSNANNPESEWFDDSTVMNLEYKHVAKNITFINPKYDRSFTYDRPEIKTLFAFLDTRNTGAIKWESITPFSSLFNKIEDDEYKVVVVAHWLIENNVLTSWGQRIVDTLDAYNSRGTYTNNQNNVTYDYSSAKGKCALIVCGHTHYDTQLVSAGGIPILNTTCDNYNRSDSELERTVGTVTEQAFDVVTMNYTDNSIKVVRIGSGNNRNFSNGVWTIK